MIFANSLNNYSLGEKKNGKMKRNQTIALGLLAFSREKCENLIIIMSISNMIKIFHGVLEQSDSYIFFGNSMQT